MEMRKEERDAINNKVKDMHHELTKSKAAKAATKFKEGQMALYGECIDLSMKTLGRTDARSWDHVAPGGKCESIAADSQAMAHMHSVHMWHLTGVDKSKPYPGHHYAKVTEFPQLKTHDDDLAFNQAMGWGDQVHHKCADFTRMCRHVGFYKVTTPS
jgi:hypothetical protein